MLVPALALVSSPSFALASFFCVALRLVGGDSCRGRLEIGSSQACDLNTGNSEARVICRELGCSATGAQRVNAYR